MSATERAEGGAMTARMCMAIDPGLTKSGVLEFAWPVDHAEWPRGILPMTTYVMDNSGLLNRLFAVESPDRLAIEVISGLFGKSGGTHQIETERWGAKFECAQEYRRPGTSARITRQKAKGSLGIGRGGDKEVRRALLAMYDGPPAGLRWNSHKYAALAVALAWAANLKGS